MLSALLSDFVKLFLNFVKLFCCCRSDLRRSVAVGESRHSVEKFVGLRGLLVVVVVVVGFSGVVVVVVDDDVKAIVADDVDGVDANDDDVDASLE